jgi:hypothetical protein
MPSSTPGTDADLTGPARPHPPSPTEPARSPGSPPASFVVGVTLSVLSMLAWLGLVFAASVLGPSLWAGAPIARFLCFGYPVVCAGALGTAFWQVRSGHPGAARLWAWVPVGVLLVTGLAFGFAILKAIVTISSLR